MELLGVKVGDTPGRSWCGGLKGRTCPLKMVKEKDARGFLLFLERVLVNLLMTCHVKVYPSRWGSSQDWWICLPPRQITRPRLDFHWMLQWTGDTPGRSWCGGLEGRTCPRKMVKEKDARGFLLFLERVLVNIFITWCSSFDRLNTSTACSRVGTGLKLHQTDHGKFV